MTVPHIAVVCGTTRDVRLSEKVARWIVELAEQRTDQRFSLLDLRDYPMPFFNEEMKSLFVPSKDPVAQRWQSAVASFDGFVFVTPEYNHGVPAVLKNALDYAYTEWNRKPMACVGYGGLGAARGIEHLRSVCVELQMAPVRTAVHIAGADFMALATSTREFSDFDYLGQSAKAMLDDLGWWSVALSRARNAPAA